MWWEEISFKDKSDLGLLTCLLSKGVDVLKKNDAGYTVLHHLLPAEQSKIRLALRGPPPPITHYLDDANDDAFLSFDMDGRRPEKLCPTPGREDREEPSG